MLNSHLVSILSTPTTVFNATWQERSQSQLGILAGERDFVWGGQRLRIHDRSSHVRQTQHGLAVACLEEQMKSLGYPVEKQVWSESVSFDTISGQIDFVNLVASLFPKKQALDGEIIIAAHYDVANSDMQVWRGMKDRTDPDFYRATPGVDDNGSGTVAVLTLMERLQHAKPPIKITFLLCDGEEPGIAGSRIGSTYFVEHLAHERKINVKAVIVLDTIGHRPPHNSFNLSVAGLTPASLPICFGTEAKTTTHKQSSKAKMTSTIYRHLIITHLPVKFRHFCFQTS